MAVINGTEVWGGGCFLYQKCSLFINYLSSNLGIKISNKSFVSVLLFSNSGSVKKQGVHSFIHQNNYKGFKVEV